MPTPTFTLIASNTLSSSQSSVVFSSIPQTYTDLVLRLSARDSTTGVGNWYALFNGQTVGAAGYTYTLLQGDGTTATSSRSSNNGALDFRPSQDSSYTANTFGSTEIYIPSYTASQNKPISTMAVSENNATTAYIGVEANLWSNTAAITEIKLVGSFVSGSSFYLYGIKNS